MCYVINVLHIFYNMLISKTKTPPVLTSGVSLFYKKIGLFLLFFFWLFVFAFFTFINHFDLIGFLVVIHLHGITFN